MYSGKSGCIRVKVVVFGQKWLCSGKVVVLVQDGCKRAKWLYSGKMVVFGKKFFLFWQKWLKSGIVVVFEQTGYIQEN